MPEEATDHSRKTSSVAVAIIAAGGILALLYVGRPILVPVTLAVVLSFAIAPLVRLFSRLGLGHTSSALTAVSLSGGITLLLALVIGLQTVELASSLPQYEAAIASKISSLRLVTLARLKPLQRAADRILGPFVDEPAIASGGHMGIPNTTGVVSVEIRQPSTTPATLLRRLAAWIWGPIGSAAIVVLVLFFVLLEHESLRDRFIRLVGGTDLRAATAAINDAGERLSRYFGRQVAVNLGVGIVLWAILTGIGLPHATLWAALAAVLRFVPYLGFPTATVVAGTFAFAASPGWSLLWMTLATFLVVQTVTSQVLEPNLYGHATGLSPLVVVLATLFWGWLWGPMGAIMATPLTLCLAVAGRHAESLSFLAIALGSGPALTLPQKFYQRALSGDSDEIIENARVFLKRKPFAAYCDSVLIPALALGRADLEAHAIGPEQQAALRGAVVRVVEALGSERHKRSLKRPRATLLQGESPGHALRERRLQRQRLEASTATPGQRGTSDDQSVVLCVALNALGDDLASELLVRILRDAHIDARHLSVGDIQETGLPKLEETHLSTVCLVSLWPDAEQELAVELAASIQRRWPGSSIMAMLWRSLETAPALSTFGEHIERIVTSFEDAVLEISENVAADANLVSVPSAETP
ncbi:MAG: AI-2E family transporter [Caldimonas sp.]